MAAIPVFNPPIPFLGEIPCSLFVGKSLHIRGQIIGDSIIRPGDKKMVRNSFQDGGWQEEEREGKCPISVGETFELHIKVKESYYKIKIDGKDFCKFKHRLPVENVHFVHIGEGVVIESVTESV